MEDSNDNEYDDGDHDHCDDAGDDKKDDKKMTMLVITWYIAVPCLLLSGC